VFCVLVNDEESEQSRREFPNGLVRLFDRQVVAHDRILVAACVVLGYEL
jgi:hypothetical protein